MVCFAPPLFLPVYLCTNVGPKGPPVTTLWGLLAAALPAPFVPQSSTLLGPPAAALLRVLSTQPQLPISAPPTSLDECFFFNSLVVGLPYSSTVWQFWLFLFLNLLLSFFWSCEEAKCVYTRLHLGQKAIPLFLERGEGKEKEKERNING